mgnify:CR=1 FL=1
MPNIFSGKILDQRSNPVVSATVILNENMNIVNSIFNQIGSDWQLNQSVKRGLDYYVENGFEVECPKLGAQKQVAGGGRYETGIGFAIGIDRLLLSKK